jgi:hypothetical protein
MFIKESQRFEMIARDGDKVTVTVNGVEKTIWSGLGNRAGLHEFANELCYEKWIKSGERFLKKLASLKEGAKITAYTYRAISRERGRWIEVYSTIL